MDNNKKALAEFYNLCAEILMGKAKEEDIKRTTKAMVDTEQQAVMANEFHHIGKLLTNAPD